MDQYPDAHRWRTWPWSTIPHRTGLCFCPATGCSGWHLAFRHHLVGVVVGDEPCFRQVGQVVIDGNLGWLIPAQPELLCPSCACRVNESGLGIDRGWLGASGQQAQGVGQILITLRVGHLTNQPHMHAVDSGPERGMHNGAEGPVFRAGCVVPPQARHVLAGAVIARCGTVLRPGADLQIGGGGIHFCQRHELARPPASLHLDDVAGLESRHAGHRQQHGAGGDARPQLRQRLPLESHVPDAVGRMIGENDGCGHRTFHPPVEVAGLEHLPRGSGHRGVGAVAQLDDGIEIKGRIQHLRDGQPCAVPARNLVLERHGYGCPRWQLRNEKTQDGVFDAAIRVSLFDICLCCHGHAIQQHLRMIADLSGAERPSNLHRARQRRHPGRLADGQRVGHGTSLRRETQNHRDLQKTLPGLPPQTNHVVHHDGPLCLPDEWMGWRHLVFVVNPRRQTPSGTPRGWPDAIQPPHP